MKKDLKKVVDSVRFRVELEKMSGTGNCLAAPKKIRADSRTSRSADGSLEALKEEVLKCIRCGLHKTRQNVVFGSGDPRAELMFVGEAPGEDEDIQSLPFVGRAGQLLTKIIEAMGLARNGVYIANILKCRPPNNRAPLPEEILACRDYLRLQIAVIAPRVIVTLGKFASQTLLGTETPISQLRGRFQEYNGVSVMPTFHPAYLLRNPSEKKTVWEDMKKVMKELGLSRAA